MKYLKGINEARTYSPEELEQLQDYCETYLAELMDKEYMVSIGWGDYRVTIQLFGPAKQNTFSWDSVKDEFIPFFEMLQSDYALDFQIRDQKSKHITLHIGRYTGSEPTYYHKSEIENIPNVKGIVCIEISIKQKSYI